MIPLQNFRKIYFETLKIALGEIERFKCPYLVVRNKKTSVNALVFQNRNP